MKNNKRVSVTKEMKRNSYELEKGTKGTVHLEHAPKPHSSGALITEDIE
ncbi:hypothetical protein SM124_06995 [Bacillus sp. 31A1R]|uniref:Uncharacterized protein n=1 Tax=Robertmurraya mangrovi TaxID=3098077 RepID=A0ABU5IWH2_9BACI|nr:hypothetical protein [Bacillus sp. 31A1R]MDZ5471492.1 hypothetical protein [Bacillus sp. 31A1R]